MPPIPTCAVRWKYEQGALSGGHEVRPIQVADVRVGQPLVTLHAESSGELSYALAFVRAREHPITIEDL